MQTSMAPAARYNIKNKPSQKINRHLRNAEIIRHQQKQIGPSALRFGIDT